MRASSGRSPRGFILPTTLLVITLVTVMLAAAFVLVSAESRATDNTFATARAAAFAQAGLDSFFADTMDVTNRTSLSATYRYSKGYASVAATRVRDSVSGVSPAIWIVYSTGYDTARASVGQPNGRRAIAQVALLAPGTLPYRTTMYAANGVVMKGAPAQPNPLTGDDQVACSSPPTDTIGLIVGPGGYSDSATAGSRPAPWGDPVGIQTLASAQAVIDSTHIDWPRLLGGDFTPEYVVLPPCEHPRQLSSAGFPTGLCIGNATIGDRRFGLLVVTGDVTLESGAHYDGIIVAGGRFNNLPASGSYVVHGMLVTGLNITMGESVLPNEIRRGSSRTIAFGSCYTGPSISRLSRLVPIKNAWIDNWPTY